MSRAGVLITSIAIYQSIAEAPGVDRALLSLQTVVMRVELWFNALERQTGVLTHIVCAHTDAMD